MDYHFSVAQAPSHLHAIGSGVHSPENLRRFLADTHREVLAHGCKAVLLEVRFTGPSLGFASLYSIVVANSADAATLARIAYVDRNTEHLPERAEFAELAANKLGVNVRVFRSIADAEKWLGAVAQPS